VRNTDSGVVVGATDDVAIFGRRFGRGTAGDGKRG
jgi:hypothetical protein